jgi:dsDNA-specific endonuclease/ATPase MutS2
MMHAKKKQHTQRNLQYEGNLAVTHERLQILQKPRDKTFPPVLRPVPAMTEENLHDDTLAPAIGILSAFGLSAILWGLIILGISWIW